MSSKEADGGVATPHRGLLHSRPPPRADPDLQGILRTSWCPDASCVLREATSGEGGLGPKQRGKALGCSRCSGPSLLGVVTGCRGQGRSSSEQD